MYSLVLLVAASSSADAAQFHRLRAGCHGAPVAQAVVEKTRVVVRTVARPLVAFASSGCTGAPVAATGCSGGMAAAQHRTPVRTLLHRLFARPQGVVMSAATYQRLGYAPLPAAVPAVAARAPEPPTVEGPFRRLLERRAVAQALESAEFQDKLTPAQKALVKRALTDRDARDMAVSEAHKLSLLKAKQQPSVAALGDGKWLKLLLDNLPAIIEAIKLILEALGK